MSPQDARQSRVVPEPVDGLLIFDVGFPDQRWRVTGVAVDDRIEARRIVPDDGILHSWDRPGWDYAWERGWLAVAEPENQPARRTRGQRSDYVSVWGNTCTVGMNGSVYYCVRPDGLPEYGQDDMTVTLREGPGGDDPAEVRFWAHDAFLDAYGGV